MASLAKASLDPTEMNNTRDLDLAEIEKSTDCHKVVEISEEQLEKPEIMDRGREFTDILISTEIDPLPWKSPNFGISYPSAGEKSPVSYSSDLIGLDMAAGLNLPVVADHDRETIHLAKSNSSITPTNETLGEVVGYLSANLPVIRQAIELEMWPQLDAIITRLKERTQETKVSLIKLPQEPCLSNGKLSSDTKTDGPNRVSERSSTSSTIYWRDDTVVLQSHGPAEGILTSTGASNFLSGGEAPAGSTEISGSDLGLIAKSEKRTDSKKTLTIHALPAGMSKDINLSVNSGNAVTSHGELDEALAAPLSILNATAELKGKEAGFPISLIRPEVGTVPEASVEVQPDFVVKRGSFEGEREDKDPIPLVGAPEQMPKPPAENEEPRGYFSPSAVTMVVPHFETQQTQGLGISGATEEHQPSPQPDLNVSRLSSVSGQIKSRSIFGTHLMPGQARRERTLSLEHSAASPSTGARSSFESLPIIAGPMLIRNIDKLKLGAEGESTGLCPLDSKSSFVPVPPNPPVIDHANTPEGFHLIYGTREAPFPTSGDSIQSSIAPSSPHRQQSHSSEQSVSTEVQDRPKIAAGPLRKFQPFSFARAGPSKMNSLGHFKEPSQVAERVALSSQPESPSKSTTKSEPQGGTAILCSIPNPLSVKSPSVFVNTYFPIQPSRFNRTGLFAPQNQHPAANLPEN